jgi:RimJ/RimL family protein N-acetyltransferase
MTTEIAKGAEIGAPLQIPRQIETERLLLRCPREEDGPALYAAAVESAERLRPWFGWLEGAVLTPKSSAASARFARWRFLAGRELQFYIFDKDSLRLLGIAGLCHPDWAKGRFALSYWLRSGCEGHGYAVEAAGALVDFAFHRLHASRLEIHCDPDNVPSLALARRLGFRLARTLAGGRRDHRSGGWRDVAVLVRQQAGDGE